tara:strand:- start:8113 stop:8580 length:468 start_codon:yes stop_codon:yes gene_type:complete
MKESFRINLKVPPPIVTLVFSGLMYALDLIYNFEFALMNQLWLMVVLLIIAFFLLFPALAQFYRQKTTVNPLKPETTKVLVIEGIYHYSRNPMYLGMAFILLAWGAFLANPLNIITFIGFILYMNVFQIKLEEEALEKIFGEDFTQYKERVRRWV